MSKHLYITNISSDTTVAELNQIFARVGTIVSMEISTDPHTGAQMSYGFVEMETRELAQAAVHSVNGFLLHNRKIQVKELGSREPDRSINHNEEPDSRVGQRRKRAGTKKAN
jgi:RNA recognition motif-containing protein